MACRSKCASHQPSLLSVLCPLRFFTSCGFARYTFTASSNALNTGFQYEPVLSITTWVTPCCFSQSRNASSCDRIVPNCRISTWGSPCNGPTMTHTAKNFLPTSIPAHRSIAAEIISVRLSRPGERLTSLGISSSSARLRHSGVLHVSLASFLFGTGRPPQAALYTKPTIAPISSAGDQLPSRFLVNINSGYAIGHLLFSLGSGERA